MYNYRYIVIGVWEYFMINSFDDFCGELMKCGFSMGGANDMGIFSLLIPENTVCKAHTGDPETDPWEWRMRVLEERNDIAYGKLFFGASGYITKEWYPYFLAVRRKGMDFEDTYKSGTVSQTEKTVYGIIAENGIAALHEIKAIGGFDNKSRFDRAVTSLQMRMFITMCGRTAKKSRTGEDYGWKATVFTTPEEFFGAEFIEAAMKISPDEAEEKIRAQVMKLNPSADEENIKRFIYA